MKNKGVRKILWALLIVFGVPIVLIVSIRLYQFLDNVGHDMMNKPFEAAGDLFRQEDYEGAIDEYTEVIENFPTSALANVALYMIGKANYELRNSKDSRQAFRKFLSLKQFPLADDNVDARRLIAHSYRLEGKYDQAYQGFDTLTSKEFDDYPQVQEEGMYYAAVSLQEQGVNEEALGRYTVFLTQFPSSKRISNAYFKRGLIYYNEKEYDLARSNYQFALKSATDLNHKAEVQLHIGHTYYSEGAFEQARTAYNSLLQEFQSSNHVQEARLLLAHIHKREGEWSKAIDEYQLIIKNPAGAKRFDTRKTRKKNDGFPRSVDPIAWCHFEIGYANYNLGTNHKKNSEHTLAIRHFKEALTAYQRFVNDFPEEAYAPVALFRAIRTLNKLRELDKRRTKVDLETGTILDMSFSELLTLEREEVLNRLANKYITDRHDNNASLPEHENGNKLKNILLAAEVQFELANTKLVELERYDKASAEFLKLWDYHPIPDPRLNLFKLRAKYYEGYCYEKLSRLNSAQSAYHEVTTLFTMMFQPLIDSPDIVVPNIPKKMFDYCIQTATDYAEKSCDKLKDTEYAKKACAKVTAGRKRLKDNAKDLDSFNASRSRDSPQKIAEIARESTVVLTMKCANGEKVYGTGFFVRSDLIATNYHVIKGAIGGIARLVGKRLSYAIVGYTAIDAVRDLAILKVRAYSVKPLLLGNSDDIQINNDIYAVGNPLYTEERTYLEGTVSYGKISGIRVDATRKWIQMTAPITHGNSGGPVLNRKGEVIGISTLIVIDDEVMVTHDVKDNATKRTIGFVKLPRRKEQNLNFAVHVDELKALLNRSGRGNSPKPLSNLEIIN